MYVMLKENLPDKDGRSRGLKVLNDKGRFNVKVSVSSPVLSAPDIRNQAFPDF
jgi:hypothetical protein